MGLVCCTVARVNASEGGATTPRRLNQASPWTSFSTYGTPFLFDSGAYRCGAFVWMRSRASTPSVVHFPREKDRPAGLPSKSARSQT